MTNLKHILIILCIAWSPRLHALSFSYPTIQSWHQPSIVKSAFKPSAESSSLELCRGVAGSALAKCELDTIRQADIRFDESIYDFGDISKSKKPRRTHTFQFTNIGSANLVILHVATGCGCTIPKYTDAPVKPGAKGTLEVTYDATDRPLGHFTKSVTIYINSTHSYVRIFIEGNVIE